MFVKRLIKLREIYVLWKQRAVVSWKLRGNTEITTACRLRRHKIQGGSNMTGTDLYVNKPHCAAAVRP